MNTEPLSCEGILELLPLYASGGASGRQRAEVAKHVARCSDCLAELVLETRLVGMIGMAIECDAIPEQAQALAEVDARIDALPRSYPALASPALALAASIVGLAKRVAILGSATRWLDLDRRLTAYIGR